MSSCGPFAASLVLPVLGAKAGTSPQIKQDADCTNCRHLHKERSEWPQPLAPANPTDPDSTGGSTRFIWIFAV